MFGDYVKIAAKTALIVVIMAAVIALFANFQIPDIGFVRFKRAIGIGLAVIYHYAPITPVLFPLVISLVTFDVGFRSFQIAMIAVRWIMKVNE